MKKITTVFITLMLSVCLFAQDYWFVPKVLSTKQQEYHEYSDSFALSYAELYEQPWFVAYTRTKGQYSAQGLERNESFRPDMTISTGSAELADYKGSGYSRGHLCPNSACNHSSKTQYDCFLLSNMSPQLQTLNGGCWLKGENAEDTFGRKYAKTYVIVGPVFNKPNYKTIGKNKVAVPDEFFRICVFTDNEDNIKECFAVVMSQATANDAKSTLNWNNTKFIKSIDEIEAKTGLDFFPALDDETEDKLESFKYGGKLPNVKFVKGKVTTTKPTTQTNTVNTEPATEGFTYRLITGATLSTIKKNISSGKYVKNMARDTGYSKEEICFSIGYYNLANRVITIEKGKVLKELTFDNIDTVAIISALDRKSASVEEIAEMYECEVLDLICWIGKQKSK